MIVDLLDLKKKDSFRNFFTIFKSSYNKLQFDNTLKVGGGWTTQLASQYALNYLINITVWESIGYTT